MTAETPIRTRTSKVLALLTVTTGTLLLAATPAMAQDPEPTPTTTVPDSGIVPPINPNDNAVPPELAGPLIRLIGTIYKAGQWIGVAAFGIFVIGFIVLSKQRKFFLNAMGYALLGTILLTIPAFVFDFSFNAFDFIVRG